MKNKQKHTLLWISLFFVILFQITSCLSVKPQEEKEEPYTRVGFAEKLTELLENNNHDLALKLFDTVPEPDASSFSILSLKLSIMISIGMMEESQILIEELNNRFPNNEEILYTQAMLASAQNNEKERTKYLNLILEQNPKHSQALSGLGLDYLSKRNYPRAKSYLLTSLQSEPSNTEAHLGLGIVYYMEKELDKALDILNLGISYNASNGSLWAERARVKSETNDLRGAIEDVETAIKFEPQSYRHWLDLGMYNISLGRKEDAKEAFTKAINLEPDHYLAYIYRAGLNDDLGKKNEAIRDYKLVCSSYPQYYFASESLGVLLWEKQDWEGARLAFQQALYHSPQNIFYALMATAAFYQQDKAKEARDFMSKYLPTLERGSTDYFLCRLFFDRSGEMDVLNRISKEKNETKKKRMTFYSALYYDLFQSKTIAQKYYLEVLNVKAPNFFEYRLCENALKEFNNASNNTENKNSKS